MIENPLAYSEKDNCFAGKYNKISLSCISFSISKDCTTIIALVLDKNSEKKNFEEAENIMKYVSNQNDLKYGKDIILSETMKNYEEFSNYLNNNKNKTYFGVIFCYDYLDTEFYSTKINIPCKPQFAQEGHDYKFYTIVFFHWYLVF